MTVPASGVILYSAWQEVRATAKTCVTPPPMTGAVFTLQRRSEMP